MACPYCSFPALESQDYLGLNLDAWRACHPSYVLPVLGDLGEGPALSGLCLFAYVLGEERPLSPFLGVGVGFQPLVGFNLAA